MMKLISQNTSGECPEDQSTLQDITRDYTQHTSQDAPRDSTQDQNTSQDTSGHSTQNHCTSQDTRGVCIQDELMHRISQQKALTIIPPHRIPLRRVNPPHSVTQLTAMIVPVYGTPQMITLQISSPHINSSCHSVVVPPLIAASQGEQEDLREKNDGQVPQSRLFEDSTMSTNSSLFNSPVQCSIMMLVPHPNPLPLPLFLSIPLLFSV
ncbi:hypothetical protein GWK47_030791 [Chionoecetes opilio]|uniref:Uncharacterized protein n=1 Tax=Chionoecetes opilio TaxID=41210 RepID=A0A8J5D4K1_CHIOP|nr:hypothetical protein GWK47_030791 [Chionoecetes opilio]